MVTTALTVGDVLATDSFGLRLLAGRRGLTRGVLWAHACEMSQPTQSLGPSELLMTVGMTMPSDGAGQYRFVEELDDAGLAGMILGEQESVPPISPEMLQLANDRGFPIMMAPPNVFFSAIARQVASANSTSRTVEVRQVGKLYHLAASAGDDASSFVQDAASLLDVGLRINDGGTGLELLTAMPKRTNAIDLMRHRTYPLEGLHKARLILSEHPGEELESLVLMSLLKVLEVLVDRVLDRADRRHETSARLMSALLSGFSGQVAQQVSRFFGQTKLDVGFTVAAFDEDDADVVARAVSIKRLPVIIGTGRDYRLALMPEAAIEDFRSLAEHLGITAGVSSTFSDYVDTRAAAEEASRVLTANHGTLTWAEYEGTTISVLSRSHREAKAIVTGVIGPLLKDDARAVELRETLFCYLRNDRHWTETATALGVHRQTLGYRLKNIQELLGVDLSRTSDVASLWIAYQAWVMLAEDGRNPIQRKRTAPVQ